MTALFESATAPRVPVAASSLPVITTDRCVQMIVQVIRDVSRGRAVEELENQITSLVSHELRTSIRIPLARL